MPTPSGARWGRRWQALGAVLLVAAPFLAWARVSALGLTVSIPGLFLHASLLVALGLLYLGVLLAPAPRPGLGALAALLGALVVAWDVRLILVRTDYVLGRLQLALAGLNEVLDKVRLGPLDLGLAAEKGLGHLGPGPWLALLGSALLLGGALLEASAWASGTRALLSVLTGSPRCRACRHRVALDMAWCPGCGRSLRPGRACQECRQWLEEDWRHCPRCGAARAG
ncbi:MAG TPA: zinc ribbon domain-containing protein [Candidatus Nitrosotenuis sp.]|jgi:RNA polymerase subunit RPABC4/transcription elongation factor Spt4|nr:zinc ribbon domain-containing protein [Candidatus Nitrosotenuis sp.]